jgi:hypothetical protein
MVLLIEFLLEALVDSLVLLTCCKVGCEPEHGEPSEDSEVPGSEKSKERSEHKVLVIYIFMVYLNSSKLNSNIQPKI